MSTKSATYEWPESQNCMECKHGSLLLEGASRYACEIGCEDNDGSHCPKQEKANAGMDITITINTDNEAFADGPLELVGILHKLALKACLVEPGVTLPIQDSNGNTVGKLVAVDTTLKTCRVSVSGEK